MFHMTNICTSTSKTVFEVCSFALSKDRTGIGPTASISQDYWGDIKEDWGTEVPQRGPGQSPGRGSGGRPEAEAFL